MVAPHGDWFEDGAANVEFGPGAAVGFGGFVTVDELEAHALRATTTSAARTKGRLTFVAS